MQYYSQISRTNKELTMIIASKAFLDIVLMAKDIIKKQ